MAAGSFHGQRPLCCLYLTGRCKFSASSCRYAHRGDDGITPCNFGARCRLAGHANRQGRPSAGRATAPPTPPGADKPLCCFFLSGACNRPADCFYRHDKDDGAPCNFGESCRRGHVGRLARPTTRLSTDPPVAPVAVAATAPPLCCFHLSGTCKHPHDCRHRHAADDGVSPCNFGSGCHHGHHSRVPGNAIGRPLCCFYLGGVCKRTAADCHYRHEPDDGHSPCNFRTTCRYGHAARVSNAPEPHAALLSGNLSNEATRPRTTAATTCEICDEDGPLQRIPGCSHGPLHCEVCLTAHITIRIREGSHTVTCPAVGCTQAIDVNLIQRLVAKADFELFSDALTRKLLSQDQDVVFCSNAACATQVTVADGRANPVVTCPLCRSKTCFLCQSAWHSGLSCAEAKLQRQPRPGDAEAEQLTQEYLRAETRHCPKCGTGPCMKTSADECDVATCPRCQPRFRFCWACGADYDVIFKTDCKSHRRDCRYYS